MSDRGQVDIDSVRFTMTVSQYTPPEDLEWVPDAATFIIKIQETDGSVTEHQYGYTCLEHAFLLRNRLETRVSCQVLWGTGLTDVQFHGETVTLFGNPEVVGSINSVRVATDDLIGQLFRYMRQHGIDTSEVATNIAESRFAPWDIDPIAIHDRLLG